ncbi:ras-related and estrogen-regulated growth inhibitor-like protein [Parasteatoda tepidariorum]|uniref:ras-related and estrogen-regulated growth inhibitor-like protein n=1 Tax=Parasteatoda tepidariorum TaxID=114398 RepID=UPI001C71D683|nr:ras-related and estrogen-regulated growth inhibitor-like protein [Parasteatoda tepidariorum]
MKSTHLFVVKCSSFLHEQTNRQSRLLFWSESKLMSKMTNVSGTRLKILVTGAEGVGKSAVTVRYLTRRYIGEYSSNTENIYKQTVDFDNTTTYVEILDASQCESHCCLQDHIDWADAFVVVYSVCDRSSFEKARKVLESVTLSKGALRAPAILLGNKRDLERGRQVAVDDGHEASLQYRCQFYEVSAAENFVGVSLAFQSLIREATAAQQLRTLPVRRKTGPALSKMIGMVFGRGEKKSSSFRKKRPSLSI